MQKVKQGFRSLKEIFIGSNETPNQIQPKNGNDTTEELLVEELETPADEHTPSERRAYIQESEVKDHQFPSDRPF